MKETDRVERRLYCKL